MKQAVAAGDLSETIDVEASGEIAELKTAVNGMVRSTYPSASRVLSWQVMSLRTLADEVSRVSREVGSQGKLGGQAHVPDVEGVWKDLTVNVSLRMILIDDIPRSIACANLSRRKCGASAPSRRLSPRAT
jgi:osomolarity two-component system sensor histidine kinase NIK1